MMMMMVMFREGGQLVTSVVLERNGLPVMPTNRVIPVIQVTKIFDGDIPYNDDCDDDHDDDGFDQEEHSSPLATSPLLPIPSPGALTVTIITTIIITIITFILKIIIYIQLSTLTLLWIEGDGD